MQRCPGAPRGGLEAHADWGPPRAPGGAGPENTLLMIIILAVLVRLKVIWASLVSSQPSKFLISSGPPPLPRGFAQAGASTWRARVNQTSPPWFAVRSNFNFMSISRVDPRRLDFVRPQPVTCPEFGIKVQPFRCPPLVSLTCQVCQGRENRFLTKSDMSFVVRGFDFAV